MSNEFERREAVTDERLGTPVQAQLRRLVKELPEEPVSLAWRSELNAKLQLQAKPRRWGLGALAWAPATGLALAGVFALAVMLRSPQPMRPKAGAEVERALVNSYVDNSASYDVAPDGMSATEANEAGKNPLPALEADPEDVGATL